jgi:hypothetical protein
MFKIRKKLAVISIISAICIFNLFGSYVQLMGSSSTQPRQMPFKDTPKLCSAQATLCEKGQNIKSHISQRGPFASSFRRTKPAIYVDLSLKSFFGENCPWLGARALSGCSTACAITDDTIAADVILTHLAPPDDRQPSVTYAVLNLETHSLRLPADAGNVALVSYHQESEVVVGYGYSVTHGLGLCVGNAEGPGPAGSPARTCWRATRPSTAGARRGTAGTSSPACSRWRLDRRVPAPFFHWGV